MRLIRKLTNFLRPSRADRSMNREMEAHLALLRDDYRERGMSEDQAREAALRSFGGVEQAREAHRQTRSLAWAEQTLQDLLYAFRGLRRSPGFTFVAVATLALGIGVNTALFTGYNAVALKSFPVKNAEQVVRFERWFESGSQGNSQYGFSWPEFDYVREHSHAFSALVAASLVVRVDQAATQFVSPNYFDEFGVPLKAGRGFLQTGADLTSVVVSAKYWHTALGSDPAALGRTLTLSGTVLTVVGITADEFTGTSVNPKIPDVWAQLSLQPVLMRGQTWSHQPARQALQILSRLAPGVGGQAGAAEVSVLIRQFDATFADTDKTVRVTLPQTSYFPNTDDIRFKALIAGVMLITGMVLFVACANVGNMLLARGASRQREISSRMALGAGSGRIVRQLLTESIVLALLGGAAGLATSIYTTRLLAVLLASNGRLIGGDIGAVDLSPDLRVALYVALVSVISGVLFGLSPALRLTRKDLVSSLKMETGSMGRPGRSRMRSFLVAGQAAASILLLATAGLLMRGMLRSRTAEPGFETHGTYVLDADLGNFDGNPAKFAELEANVAARLKGKPEVASLAIGGVPFTGTWTRPVQAGGLWARTLSSFASNGYFDVMGIGLVRGREFTIVEGENTAPVALVSETTARTLWRGEDPVGKTFLMDMDFRGHMRTFNVIGVVKDVRYSNLTRVDPLHIYLAGPGPASSIVLRLRADRETTARMLAALPESLIRNARAMNLEESFVAPMRKMSDGLAWIAVVLAGLSVSIAGIGIFGVVSYLVGQRTREIGVRIALGAGSRSVLGGIVVQALRPVFAGSVAGIVLAAGVSAVLHQTLIFPGSMDFFYGIPFYDPITFGGILVFGAALAILASWIPALRALSVDPAVALRYE